MGYGKCFYLLQFHFHSTYSSELLLSVLPDARSWSFDQITPLPRPYLQKSRESRKEEDFFKICLNSLYKVFGLRTGSVWPTCHLTSFSSQKIIRRARGREQSYWLLYWIGPPLNDAKCIWAGLGRSADSSGDSDEILF